MTAKIVEPKKESLINKKSNQQNSDVVIGVLVGVDAEGQALVAYPESPSELATKARSTVTLNTEDIGREVALLFENGQPDRPLIIGRIQQTQNLSTSESLQPFDVNMDDERLEFTAKKEIVLRCGKASITLTKAGKVLIRGAYLLSRSSGANRIKGGSIQLN